MVRLFVAIGLTITASVNVAAAQQTRPRKVLPVDDARSDQDLLHVRAQIVEAVAHRDLDLLLPVLGPKVQIDFDAVYAPREFVTHQKAVCAAHPCDDFWRELHDAISLGMAKDRERSGMYAPYVFVNGSGDDYDALVITGSRVALRSAPAADAPAREFLSYDIVRIKRTNLKFEDRAKLLRIGDYVYGWFNVVAPGGKAGWVSEKYARSVLDTRIYFQKIDGQWKVTAIATGD